MTTKATIADRANSEEEHAEQSESEAPGRRDKWPGSSRRERRQWAMSRGFGYTKRDDFLHDEWARGTAASGAPVREVVSGTVGDYEMYLADIGGTTVMAVRRGSSSDIVVEAHRGVPQGAEDLVPVRSTAGFRILSNDVGATERLIDARVDGIGLDSCAVCSPHHPGSVGGCLGTVGVACRRRAHATPTHLGVAGGCI